MKDLEEIENKFISLCYYFENYGIFSENKSHRGRTFSGKKFVEHYEAFQSLDVFTKIYGSILLTSSNNHIREITSKLLNRPNLIVPNPDKRHFEIYALSARRDIQELYGRSFHYHFGNNIRAARFACLMENIYEYVKQQLIKRHWKITPYFKDIKVFAKYVKAREKYPYELALSEQTIQISTSNIIDDPLLKSLG